MGNYTCSSICQLDINKVGKDVKRKKGILTRAATWMKLKDILSEKSQKDKYYMIPLI